MKHTLCYALVLSIVLPLAVLQARSTSLPDVSALQTQVARAKENEKAAKKNYDAAAKADRKLDRRRGEVLRGGSFSEQHELDESAAKAQRAKKEWWDAQDARKERETALERAQKKLL